MSALVDPNICPDCRAPLDASATCTGCGLRLVGPPALELWQHMQQADRLITQMRATPAAAVPAVQTGPGRDPALPPAPPVPGAATQPRRLPSASVPLVLLVLGGLCLLVAAVVFVAVAWSSLGLAAKTVIMLGVTALVAAAAVTTTRRGLRFAAETLWVVVSGLVAVDIGAAYSSDLLGLERLGDRGAVVLLGAVLLGLAVGVGVWAGTTGLERLHGLVGVGAVGTVLLAGAAAWTSDQNPGAVAVSIPVLVALAWAIDRGSDGHLRATALVVAAAGLVSWLELVGYGVDRMTTVDGDAAWWSDLTGWPLLVAAALAAALALVGRAPAWSRMVAAGGSLVTLGLFLVGPSTDPTADLLSWAAVSILLAVVCATAPTVWRRPAAALAALSLLLWTPVMLARPVEAVTGLPAAARPDHLDLDLTVPSTPGGPAAWTALVASVVVCVLAAALLRQLPTPVVRDVGRPAVVGLAPGMLALGATTALLETEPTLVLAVSAWSGTLAIAAAMAVVTRTRPDALAAVLGFVLYLVVVGVRLAAPSHLLAALLTTAIAAVAAIAYARAGRELLHGLMLPVLGATTVLAAGVAASQWPYVADGRGDAAGVTLAVVAAAALLLAGPVARDEASRRTIEVTALVVGLAATQLPQHDTAVTVVLTVVGSAIAALAVLNRDREPASWLAVVVLGVAMVLRVDQDVRLPELSTLPAAVLLLVAGWWRLDGDELVSSTRALGSGLTLALGPSLVLALDDPVSLRGALVAVAGLLSLAVGVVRSWAAPFVAGTATTAVLAVRQLGPVVEGLPRWISLGSVGLLLLVVGVTWEQRRRDVATASRYLASLR